MKADEILKARPRARKALVGAAVVLVLFTLVGFFAVPPLARSYLVKTLSRTLHREVSIREISVNPYALTVTVDGLSIGERGAPGTFLSFGRLHANLEIASVVKRGIVLREIRLVRPYVNLVRDRTGRYNFSDLVEEFAAPKKEPSAPLRFSLNNIQIDNGAVNFWDGPKRTGHEVREMTVRIPFLSNFSYAVETFVEPLFRARINGHPVSLTGRTKPFSGTLESVVDLRADGLPIPHYLEYAPVRPRFQLRSALLDLRTELAFIQRPDAPPAVRLTGDVAFRDIDLRDSSSRPMIGIPRLDVKGIAVESAGRTVAVGSVSARRGAVVLRRDRDGVLNAAVLAPAPPAAPAAAAAREAPRGTEESPWVVTVGEVALSEWGVRWEDASPPEPVVVAADNVEVGLKNLSTKRGDKAEASLAMRVARKGTISVRGVVGIEPLSAELSVDAKGIGIKPVQPYFADKVRILVTDGAVRTRGTVTLADGGRQGMRIGFRGEAGVFRFASLDKDNSEEFLSFQSLHFDGVNLSVNPFRLAIAKVALADFASRLVVNADGTLNVQGIVAGDNAASRPSPGGQTGGDGAAAAGRATEPKPVRIDQVTLQGGTVAFTDRLIRPSYSATLTEIGGRVSGLTSDDNVLADVDLRGRFEGSAPLEITGKINPLGRDFRVDLAVDFKDMELGPLSPYSGKYAGYGIQKGKLSLELKYLIVSRKLDSRNVVRLDQFAFGDPVESKDATKLPVRLAVALLRDRQGNIRLDLPVAGSLDDPKFSVWGVVFQIIKNLLVKAATAPFALLGAIFGGGEELSYVEFDPGRQEIPPGAAQKLATIEKVLFERPSLTLDIVGHVDPEKDREGLRQELFRRKVAAQKARESARRAEPAVPLDNVLVGPAEYPRFLERAYKEEKFPKPRNIIGLAKTLPVPEMEKLMLAHIAVTDDDLRQLAIARAKAAKEQLLRSQRIEPGRVFIVEPKSLPPEKKEKARDSRVDFVLK